MKGFILLLALMFVGYACSVETGYTSDDAQGQVKPNKKRKLKNNRDSRDQDEDTNGSDEDDKKAKKSKKKKKSKDDDEKVDDEKEDEEVVEEEIVDPPVDLTVRGPLKQDPANANVWVFTIPDNHGVNPWNADTEENLIRMKDGETLRIVFLDTTVNHQLHSSNNNGPCNHGGNRQYDANGQEVNFNATAPMGPGTSIECDVTVIADRDFRDGNANFYDHTNQGNNAGRKIFAHFGLNAVPAWVDPAAR